MSKEHVNLDHAREDHQRDTMKRIIKDGVCPFCRENFEQYHTKPILFETEHWLVTENFAPYDGTEQHLLLVPREHCAVPDELSREAWGDLQDVLARIRREMSVPGGAFLMRFGDTEYTGGTVTHLHAQVIVGASRKEGGEPLLTTLGYKKD
jgi:diadenosine tetraphosphate (Ap4A) HIT family hydrolase